MRRVGTPRRCATTSARVRGRALRRPTSDPDHGREWLFEEGHQLGWSSPPVLGDGLEGGELPGGGGVSGLCRALRVGLLGALTVPARGGADEGGGRTREGRF